MFTSNAVSVKVGAVMDTGMVVVALSAPEVPVMMTFAVPPAAELLAVKVSTLVPLVGFVPHDAVTPVGRPDVTTRLTLPVNPYNGVTVMVDVPMAPWLIDRLAGNAEREKLGP